ncbi:protein Mis18-alpha-like isoform X1 [Hyla sarda]|uniref:protein Mis18-alpha-like isoform X1 n=1 Tax=Hyla sarda TaxID=327740 RepID=UPI0024C36B5B|nr:protein Mis18-alpha-like isoform X1 [Hyla sarda]
MSVFHRLLRGCSRKRGKVCKSCCARVVLELQLPAVCVEMFGNHLCALQAVDGMAGPSRLTLDMFSVFMCKDCKTILAEGRDACECNDMMDVIACISATKEVEVEETMRYDLSPDLQGCVYSHLKCKGCAANVGMILTCAVSEVAHLRRLFCFFKNSILCYSTKTKQLLEGNQFDFNIVHCVIQVEELQDEIVEISTRVHKMADLVRHHVPSSLPED